MSSSNEIFDAYIKMVNSDDHNTRKVGLRLLENYIKSLPDKKLEYLEETEIIFLHGEDRGIKVSIDADYELLIKIKPVKRLYYKDLTLKLLIKELIISLRKNKYVILWYAGHGTNIGGSYPVIQLNENYDSTKILYDFMKNFILRQEIKNKTLLLFFDCCNKFGRSPRSYPQNYIDSKLYFLQNIKPCIGIILSARPGFDADGDENGSFFIRKFLALDEEKKEINEIFRNMTDHPFQCTFKYFGSEYDVNELYNEILMEIDLNDKAPNHISGEEMKIE